VFDGAQAQSDLHLMSYDKVLKVQHKVVVEIYSGMNIFLLDITGVQLMPPMRQQTQQSDLHVMIRY
jgi:hypothetical protein